MSLPGKPPPDDARHRRTLRRELLKLTPPPSPAPRGHPTPSVPSTPSACCGGSPQAGPSAASCCGGSPSRPDLLLRFSATLFVLGLAAHLLPLRPDWLTTYAHSCVSLLRQAWWGIAIGIVTVAIIGRVPREVVAALLGRPGSINGLLRAVGAGVALDLCNHGILMVAMSLYRRGASVGQTFAFLIASPWNSLSLTLILAALIGWYWMALFIVLSMAVALLTGWLAERLVAKGKIPANPHSVDLPDHYPVGPAIRNTLRSLRPSRQNLIQLLREGLSGSRMVLRWILFGFVVTSLIRTFVPPDIFSHYFGPSLAGLFLTLVATTVIEVCSEGSSPIAADLLTRAHAPGNAFVFLMAGAATDYTELASLHSTTRSWRTTLALPLLATPQILIIGWLLQR